MLEKSQGCLIEMLAQEVQSVTSGHLGEEGDDIKAVDSVLRNTSESGDCVDELFFHVQDTFPPPLKDLGSIPFPHWLPCSLSFLI
jgi:hypothetical protein